MLAVVIFPFLINAQDKSREMVKIPAGSFIMGGGYDDPEEKPKHKVFVDAFYMDKFKVTQGEYKKLMGINPSATKERLKLTEKLKDKNYKPTKPIAPVGDNYPVTNVSWYDAAKYCNARSKAEGLEPCYDEKTWKCDFTKNGYRLPTEAEWEYACRAGSNGKYFWGDDESKLPEYEVYWPESTEYVVKKSEANIYDKPFVWTKGYPVMKTIGTKKPNKWGLYDILGNADEWCNDWYGYDYYKKSPTKNPRGPENSEEGEKILRGGSFRSIGICGDRAHTIPTDKGNMLGFRCVRNAPKEEKKETEKKDVKDKKPGEKSKDKGED